MAPKGESACITTSAADGLGMMPEPIPNLEIFFSSVAHAAESGLYLDFDGTLASIRIDPSAARPWAGVRHLLRQIQQSPRCRLAIVSGRPASEVALLLGMDQTPEIWGLHGAERLGMDGRLDREPLGADEQAALHAARAAVENVGFQRMPGIRVEEKWNAIALHWRGLSQSKLRGARDAAIELIKTLPRTESMSLLEFSGGVELRAGRNKGGAVRLLLKELDAHAPVAYLGDDTTDEDAFKALAHRGLGGLGVLIRRTWRPTAAQLWLRPPQQLRAFLSAWVAAVR